MKRIPPMTSSTGRVGRYSADFFRLQEDGSRRSADVIVPLVLELVNPSSVVDFGCAIGSWLAAFRERGVADVLGIDGSYVAPDQLQIPRHAFAPHDLTRPVRLQRAFDLAVSVEVAEHLDGQCAEEFIESLTNAAPVVLFSAACPLQGGEHHVNEQWPSYWERIFRSKHYVAIDALRSSVWSDDRVEWWYAQNMLLFCRDDRLGDYPNLVEAYARTDHARLDVVHPRNYAQNNRLIDYWAPQGSTRQLLKALLSAATRSVRGD